jgi:hypothetical protein
VRRRDRTLAEVRQQAAAQQTPQAVPRHPGHGSSRRAATSRQTNDRQDRSASWFGINRRGGSVLLHHRHIRPVLIREWSTPMDGITATISASQTTGHAIDD